MSYVVAALSKIHDASPRGYLLVGLPCPAQRVVGKPDFLENNLEHNTQEQHLCGGVVPLSCHCSHEAMRTSSCNGLWSCMLMPVKHDVTCGVSSLVSARPCASPHCSVVSLLVQQCLCSGVHPSEFVPGLLSLFSRGGLLDHTSAFSPHD